MASQTNDQYAAVVLLDKWYHKYSHQIIEISGVVGTGIWEVLQEFIDDRFDPREIMYLSYNQRQVIDLASKGYHSYYINGIIYNYERIVDLNTLPVINPHSDGNIKYEWRKSVKKKIDPKYRLMVVFDSTLLSREILNDLASFELPIILVRDPMLLPAPDSHTFLHDPNIILREIHPDYGRNPVIHFAHKIIMGEPLIPGSYDTVSIVPRKQMNLYNLRSSDMNISLTEDSRNMVNSIYRERILRRKDSTNCVGERIIIMDDLFNERLVYDDNKRIKVYLRKGVVGTIRKINRHVPITKYVRIDFRPEFYDDDFLEIYMDRHYLNGIETKSRQIIPDEYCRAEYAYALTPQLARLSHWDKITLMLDANDLTPEMQTRMIYTAITRAKRSATIII